MKNSKIIDLFGRDTTTMKQPEWAAVVRSQQCPFVQKRCYKVRKSQPEISIGTCTVRHGNDPVIICPLGLLERRQIFIDCLRLLSHEPGNEIHLVGELGIPGGSLDYCIASVRDGKVRDFVGAELQALDTIGTVWPERQRFLKAVGFAGISEVDTGSRRPCGVNWKMTAKTILVQLHHKIGIFERLKKHLVLVFQDRLLDYMTREFSFDHLRDARRADPMHFHAYGLLPARGGHQLVLKKELSTDAEGVARCLGMQEGGDVQLDVILGLIGARLTMDTRFTSV
ncbi:MAG: hypothetical protein FWD68_04015 [Alphaproteobacteria bacterium]|nr:hypothetical protein [Alphaproteobacteria bacterium]